MNTLTAKIMLFSPSLRINFFFVMKGNFLLQYLVNYFVDKLGCLICAQAPGFVFELVLNIGNLGRSMV